MKCDHIKYLLSEYIDDHVNDNQEKLIEKHLLGCPNCRSVLKNLKEYKKQVRQMQHVKAPVDLEDSVYSTIQAKTITKQEFKMPGWLKIAAAAMIIGFVYLLTPDNYFRIPELELQYIPVEQKGSKDPAIPKKSNREVDIRIHYFNELVKAHGGKIISTKQKKAESNFEHITAEIPRDKYNEFSVAFNAGKPLYKLPEKLPFSFRKMVRIAFF